MFEVLDVSAVAPASSLEAALASGEPVARARLSEGGQSIEPRPMLWPCAAPEVAVAHADVGESAPVDLIVIRDGSIGGPGGHVRKDAAYPWERTATPPYVRHWMIEGLTPEYWAFEPGRPIRLPRAYSIVHFNQIFGHWLTEMFPKLFVIGRLAARGVRAPVVLPDTAPAYVRTIIEDVLPGQEIVTYDPATEHIQADQVLMPSMMHRGDYVFHPGLADELADYAANRAPPRGLRRRIFVSRARLEKQSAFRRLGNAAALERTAADLGLEIVHPEQLRWRDQVSLFAQAELIVGEFGSAMHSALFSPPGTKIVCLNWISEVQSRIGNFCGHDLGYILDPDGRPRIYDPDQGVQEFSINPLEMRDRLRAVLDGLGPMRGQGLQRVLRGLLSPTGGAGRAASRETNP